LANLLIQAAATVALGAAYRALMPKSTVQGDAGRLEEAKITTASEGTEISQLWGRQRVPGRIIWATKFREVVEAEPSTDGSGKGGGPNEANGLTYRYFQSFAIGLCEAKGARIRIGRIWVDGAELDQSKYTIRFYDGSEAQVADPLIAATEGDSPAFKGLAYLVFDDFEVSEVGNRIPQISVEVSRSLDDDPNRIEEVLEAVTMIPGASEFGYGTRIYYTGGSETSTTENVSQVLDTTDFEVSMDQLEDDLSNISSVELVVTWFADDLRCDSCSIKPKVDATTKEVSPVDWLVATEDRATADLVSEYEPGKMASGGTPADITVREALTEIKNRGHRAVFYPFIIMDIESDNTLSNPYSDNATVVGQPAYPWRGRVTCSPAAGYSGSVDKTAAAAAQVDTFVGTAAVSDFATWDGDKISYTGPSEWSFRRMVLHYAYLCKDVLSSGDAFIIGTEMEGMTTIRSSESDYPFVDALVSLVADVKSVLAPGVKVSYAANWSEYHSHRPDDGSGDVYFNMDPLWAVCDFIGIDNYLPLTDWRTADEYDYRLDALMEGVEGGEYYDYYYASEADREDNIKAPITDEAYLKHWVFRQKDMRGWWQNSHINRPNGVESGGSTSWVPSSKPIWFTEFGCAAIDKGANQPNVFLDPKSSESAMPYFSSGARDDLIQRRYIEAWIKYWSVNSPAGMLSQSDMFAWTWDARPYPAFPYGEWGDRDNWRLGHWLNGRLNVMYLKDVCLDLGASVGLDETYFDFTGLEKYPALVRGHLSTAIKSPRRIIEELALLSHSNVFESEGVVKVARKRRSDIAVFSADDLVSSSDNPGGFEIVTAQETELPREVTITFSNEANAFQSATANGKRQTGNSQLVQNVRASSVLEPEEARNLSEELLNERVIGRQSFKGAFPRDLLRYDPGDLFSITLRGRTADFRITEMTTGSDISVEAVRSDKSIYTPRAVAAPLATTGSSLNAPGSAVAAFIDIPLLTADGLHPWAPRIAGYQNPWPGKVVIYQEDGSGGFASINSLNTPAVMGETTATFLAGRLNMWDNKSTLAVNFYGSASSIMSLSATSVLNGANTVAVETSTGWELVQFRTATIQPDGSYELTGLLRGQNGTEYAMETELATGARVIFVDASWGALNVAQDQLGIEKTFRYGPIGVPVGDARYTEVIYTPSTRPLMPFSPVHLKRKTSGTAHVLQWTRRSRLNADAWDGAVPLNEESESYEIDIYDGSTIVRTIEVVGATSALYTETQQTSDFGSNQLRLKFTVYQISATVGRGEGATYDDT